MDFPLLETREPSPFHSSVSQRLARMGFDRGSVEALLSYYSDIDLSTAVKMLIKTERGWEHLFIPSDRQADVCTICQDGYSHHMETSNRRPSFHYVFEESDGVCGVCLIKPRAAFSLDCKHWFCRECVLEYLAVSINEGKVIGLSCPQAGCTEAFTPGILEQLLPPPLFSKYTRFKTNYEIEHDETARWCSTPNCGEILRTGSNSRPQMKCPKCGLASCFKCGEKWHPTMTCEESVDSSYDLWARGKPVQQCPQCRRRVEKEDGCNHVSCHVCRYQWCWLCRSQYTPMHYSPINPFGCPGLQGEEHTTARWPCYKICFLRLCLLLVMPFIVIFGISSIFTASVFRLLKQRSCCSGPCASACLLPFVFLLGLCISPIVMAFGLLPLLAFILVKSCRSLKQWWQRKHYKPLI